MLSSYCFRLLSQYLIFKVQSVLNELRTSRGIPKLSIQEAEVVADVVKAFLRDLRVRLERSAGRLVFES